MRSKRPLGARALAQVVADQIVMKHQLTIPNRAQHELSSHCLPNLAAKVSLRIDGDSFAKKNQSLAHALLGLLVFLECTSQVAVNEKSAKVGIGDIKVLTGSSQRLLRLQLE